MPEDKNNKTNGDKEIICESVSDEMDGRKPYDYVTKYDKVAIKEIRKDCLFIFIVFFLAVFFVFLTLSGIFASLFQFTTEYIIIVNYYALYSFSGLLGGIVFSMKFFYHAVAKGMWNLDRRYWRVMSPFISMAIALVIGGMASAGMLTAQQSSSNAGCLVIGFIAGYFADNALAKMLEVAKVVFGNTKDCKDTKNERN
jgi:hypothetical protein